MKVVQLNGAITPVVIARSEPFASQPEKSGVIRVDDYCQECAMQSDGGTGAKGMINNLFVHESVTKNYAGILNRNVS